VLVLVWVREDPAYASPVQSRVLVLVLA